MNQPPTAAESRISPNMSALAERCLQDLEAIPAFLRANDAGAQQPATAAEQARRDAALDTARREAENVQDEAQCTAILQTYLSAWRREHLTVRPVQPKDSAGANDWPNVATPSIELLSHQTALITIPNFFPAAREPLAALIEQHRRDLAARPNWIVDVRGNGGGADTTYASLLPWLMPDGWIEVSERVFVTPNNLRAEQGICEEMAPRDAELARMCEAVVQRMRSASEGSWVQHVHEQGWDYERPGKLEQQRPQRVAVLMDTRCGSSCEQFLLTVRQSFSVKLVGHGHSGGALDVSNLRPHLLPSGQRRLWYATTLSNRLPALPIDGIGVYPDVFLPDPEDKADRFADVRRTQRWLEHGGW